MKFKFRGDRAYMRQGLGEPWCFLVCSHCLKNNLFDQTWVIINT
jgi:hypothetical protein